jgi:hypothetical protein
MLALMTVAGSFVVCNQYYIQPFLMLVKKHFEIDFTQSALLEMILLAVDDIQKMK